MRKIEREKGLEEGKNEVEPDLKAMKMRNLSTGGGPGE